MSIESFPAATTAPEALERLAYKISDDMAVAIARGFDRLEEQIGAAESRIKSQLAEIEARIADNQNTVI
jgi:hypothetical protein